MLPRHEAIIQFMLRLANRPDEKHPTYRGFRRGTKVSPSPTEIIPGCALEGRHLGTGQEMKTWAAG